MPTCNDGCWTAYQLQLLTSSAQNAWYVLSTNFDVDPKTEFMISLRKMKGHFVVRRLKYKKY